MDDERDEQVVFLKDLLFAVLYQWKPILAAALVLAVLLGGYKAVSAFNAPDPDAQEKYQTELEKYESKKAALEQSAATIERNLAGQKTYLEESVLMGLDPYAFYEASMVLYVDNGYQIMPDTGYQDPDNTGAILQAYLSAFTGDQVVLEAAENLELEARYLRELLKVTVNDTAGMPNHVLTVTVRYSDQIGAERILAVLEGRLEAVSAQVSGSVGSHSVSVVSKSCGLRTDITLVTAQKAETDRVNTLMTDLDKTKTSLKNLQAPVQEGDSGKDVAKYAILGAAVGVVLVAAAACVAHIASGKVYSQRVLEARTAVNVIAKLADPEKKRKNPVDRWLRKLEGRAADRPDAGRLAAATVRSCCAGGKTLLVTGDASGETCRALAEKLNLKDIKVIPCGSLLEDPKAVEALVSCDCVLLAEKRGCSSYENISRAKAQISRQGKDLIGCVLFE